MSPSAPPTRSELKRQAVLDAAAHEFLHQGFDGTTMDAIAKTASVSKRTVYHHFASKEKLFAAIVSELLNRVGELEPVSYDASRALNTQLDEIGLRLASLIAFC